VWDCVRDMGMCASETGMREPRVLWVSSWLMLRHCRFMEELSDFYKLNVNQSYAWGIYLCLTTMLPIGVTAAVGAHVLPISKWDGLW
jgi:hypothetical protein